MRVLTAICRRETPRFSRASRSRAPTVWAGEPWGIRYYARLRAKRFGGSRRSLGRGGRSMYGNGLARVKRTPQLRDNAVQMTIGRHARRRHEDADTSETCSAGASNFGRARDRHTADRKDGYPACGAARRSQVIQARGRMPGIFRRRLKQGAEDQVISDVRRCRLVDAVNRSAHQRLPSEQRSRSGDADRVAAQVYSVCAGGSSNVDAIVDEHLRGAAVRPQRGIGTQARPDLVLRGRAHGPGSDRCLLSRPRRRAQPTDRLRRGPWTAAGGRSQGRS